MIRIGQGPTARGTDVVAEEGVSISVSTEPSAKILYHKYDLHPRFKDLRSSSRLSRLQLAALCASTSSLLPNPKCRLTGTQMAMLLLHHSWSNVPLDAEESEQLLSVELLGGHLSPGLRLLAHDLRLSASELIHLHLLPPVPGSPEASTYSPELSIQMAADAGSMYLQEAREGNILGILTNPKSFLTQQDEKRCLDGFCREKGPVQPEWFRGGKARVLIVDQPPIDAARELKEIEDGISSCVYLASKWEGRKPPFPLQSLSSIGGSSNGVPIAKDMEVELMRSWAAYSKTDAPSLCRGVSLLRVREMINAWKRNVSKHRRAMQGYVVDCLQLVPDQSISRGATILRMMQASDLAPLPNLYDLATLLMEPPSSLRGLNPFLSDDACNEIHLAIGGWMQFCVLEGRIERLEALAFKAEDKNDPTLLRVSWKSWDQIIVRV